MTIRWFIGTIYGAVNQWKSLRSRQLLVSKYNNNNKKKKKKQKQKASIISDRVTGELGFSFQGRGPIIWGDVHYTSSLSHFFYLFFLPREILGKVGPTSGVNRWRESWERDNVWKTWERNQNQENGPVYVITTAGCCLFFFFLLHPLTLHGSKMETHI